MAFPIPPRHKSENTSYLAKKTDSIFSPRGFDPVNINLVKAVTAALSPRKVDLAVPFEEVKRGF